MRTKLILLFCPYPLDTVPGQRLKYEQYLPIYGIITMISKYFPFLIDIIRSILYKQGRYIEKTFGVIRVFSTSSATSPSSFADGIYIFLNVSPIGPPILERLLLFFAKSCIYDIDDMVHHLRTPANKMFSWLKSRNRYFLLLAQSDHVITCTPELTKIASSYNKSVTDISSTIDTDTYLPVNLYVNDRRLTIGWTGSHSTVPYLHLLDDVFIRLARVFDFTLTVMGTDHFHIPGVCKSYTMVRYQ